MCGLGIGIGVICPIELSSEMRIYEDDASCKEMSCIKWEFAK